MSSKRRGIFLLIGVCVLASVAAAATYQAYQLQYGVPDPATADRDGLFRWLVLRDLAREPSTVRTTLAVRIEGELNNGATIDSATSVLEAEQLVAFRRNVDVLVDDWLGLKSQAFSKLPEDDRAAWIDGFIDLVERSGLANCLASKSSPAESGQPLTLWQAGVGLQRRLNAWLASVPESEQPDARSFAAALQARVLWRAFQG